MAGSLTKWIFSACLSKYSETMNLYCFVIFNFFCGRFLYKNYSPPNLNFFLVIHVFRTIVLLCVTCQKLKRCVENISLNVYYSRLKLYLKIVGKTSNVFTNDLIKSFLSQADICQIYLSFMGENWSLYQSLLDVP